MDYKPRQSYKGSSYTYKKKRIFWFNSAFNDDFTLVDGKIDDITFNVPPFQTYKNNNLKLLTFVREDANAKPIIIKLKEPYLASRSVINTDKEAYPIIYANHTGVEAMTSKGNNFDLTPQQIPKFVFKFDDTINKLTYNSYFSSVVNGSLSQVAGGSPDNKYIVFNSSGSFVLSRNLVCDIFMIGGGGGGGYNHGGGGGAGAYFWGCNLTLNAGTYTITIGAGGTQDNSGGNTSISLGGINLYLVNGGGKGGSFNTPFFGANGGCGGGGAGWNNNSSTDTTWAGGSASNSGTNGNGFAGGFGRNQFNSGSLNGGGGGGIGGVGENAPIGRSSGFGAKGGNGLIIDITGVNQVYGGGGGGGVWGDQAGANIQKGIGGGVGNIKVGGDGGKLSAENGENGVANTGSGGGGGGPGLGVGGTGGSGVIIIRFRETRINGITPVETLVQATNSSISVVENSKYQINYQNPINIPKGTYETIFSNGGITFKSKPDYTYPVLNINPVAWYKFDGSQFLYDSSGNTQNLTNINNSQLSDNDFIKGSSSLKLNGSNQYLSNSNFYSLNSTNFSISVWIKKTNNSVVDRIISVGSVINTNNTIVLTYDTDNKIRFAFWGNDLLSANAYADAGSWVHLVATYNSTSRARNLYRNGVLIANDTAGAGLNVNNVLYIGQTQGLLYFNGLMDDLRFYNMEISPLEVYDLYNGNTDRSYPILKDANGDTINPLVWYKFDVSTTSLLSDASGNGRTLTASTSSPTFDNTSFIKGNGSALFVSANNQYFSMPRLNYNAINIANGISFSFWCRLTNSTDNNAGIIEFSSYGVSNANIIVLRNVLTNNLRFYSEGGTTVDITTSGINFFDGIWRHIVWTISKSGFWTIYSNATSILTNTGKILPVFTSASNVDYIGSRNDGLTGIDGNIDDFRIYDIELSATQVSELYNGRVSIYNPPNFEIGLEMNDVDLVPDNTISPYK